MQVPFAPRVAFDVGQSTRYEAGEVAPFQDASAQQITQIGRGLSALGGALDEIADDQQDRIDSARTKGMMNTLREFAQGQIAGYRTKLGMDAVNGRPDVREALRAEAEKLAGTADNPRQADLYSQQAQALVTNAYGDVDAHFERQTAAYEIGETKAALESYAKEALQEASGGAWDTFDSQGNPGKFALAKANMLAQSKSLARQLGLPANSAQAKALELEATTALHTAVVTQFADQDPQKASAYLTWHRSEIDPAGLKPLDKLVQTAQGERKAILYAIAFDKAGFTEEQSQAELDKLLEQGGESGLTANEYRTALAFVNKRAAEKRQNTAIANNTALDDAQAWALDPANKGQPLPATKREALRTLGVESKFDFWEASGQRDYTTPDGFAFMNRITANPELLRSFESAEQLRDVIGVDLSRADMLRASNAWAAVTAPAEAKPLGKEDIDTLVRQRMMSDNLLPRDENPSEEERIRFDRMVWEIRQNAPGGDQAAVSQAYDRAVRQMVQSPRGLQPTATLFPDELVGAYYDTPFGRAPVEALRSPVVQRDIARIIEEANRSRARKGQPLLDPANEAVQAEFYAQAHPTPSGPKSLGEVMARPAWDQSTWSQPTRAAQAPLYGPSYEEWLREQERRNAEQPAFRQGTPYQRPPTRPPWMQPPWQRR